MTNGHLVRLFNKARENDFKYIVVAVKVALYPAIEFIINTRENFDAKEDYYIEAYDEIDGKLVLKHCHDIEMVDAAVGNNLTVLIKKLQNPNGIILD